MGFPGEYGRTKRRGCVLSDDCFWVFCLMMVRRYRYLAPESGGSIV
jgi:hypothetical protein